MLNSSELGLQLREIILDVGENDRISVTEDTEKSREIMGDHLLFLVFSSEKVWGVGSDGSAGGCACDQWACCRPSFTKPWVGFVLSDRQVGKEKMRD